MRSNIARFLFSAAVLVVFTALEDMLPKFFGVGVPLLLAAAQFHAVRRSVPAMGAFAVAAGAAEDAISSLPPLTSASYFLAVCLAARRMDIPRVAIFFSYPVYQIWLAMWTSDLYGSVFSRVLVALPAGAVVMFSCWAVLAWSERRFAVDE